MQKSKSKNNLKHIYIQLNIFQTIHKKGKKSNGVVKTEELGHP